MENEGFSVLEIMWKSGVIVNLVTLLLIVSSIVSWAIVIFKYGFLKKMKSSDKVFHEIFKDSQNLKEVREKAKDLDFSPSKTMFLFGHEELNKIKRSLEKKNQGHSVGSHFESFGLSCIERSLNRGIIETNQRLESLLSYLASVGSISPFMGLFGTVWGIIDSFTGFAVDGATIEAVAPGIAVALVTTALGLAVAIPSVFFFNYFANENRKINSNMESFGQEFLNIVERSLAGGA